LALALVLALVLALALALVGLVKLIVKSLAPCWHGRETRGGGLREKRGGEGPRSRTCR